MNKPINNHPMQIRKDLQKEEMVPVWDTRTGECFYIKHTPTLDVEYIWSPDDGGELNDEGANTILKIRCGTGVHSVEGNYNHPKNLEEDLLVLAISIDWEDKEHKTCVPEVPAATEEQREALHDKAQGKVNGTEDFLHKFDQFLTKELGGNWEYRFDHLSGDDGNHGQLHFRVFNVWGKQFD